MLTLPSAKEWSFPPRPETHHVRSILPSLRKPNRLHVAIEAGALLRSDDAGATWRDRVPRVQKTPILLRFIEVVLHGYTRPQWTAISRASMMGTVGDVLLTA
jgi:hypothetical protein